MKKSVVFLSMLLILTVFPLYSQEYPQDDEDTAEPEAISDDLTLEQSPEYDENQLFIIADFVFDIKGRTRPDALIYNVELKKGEIIQGESNLEKYIRDKTQMLINQRVLKDNAEINYSISEQEIDGAYPVVLSIKVEDSWNIIALPRPYYKSDVGFDFTIKARDYNFLGRMNPLRVDLGYKYDENHRSSFTIEVDSDTPFRAFGYNWNFIFGNLFSYRPQVEEPYYYRNITGLSMELPFYATTFTFGFEESVILNEENTSDYRKEKYGEFQNGPYMSSELYTSWKIPTGLHISEYGELTYTPEISAVFNHEFPDWPLHSFRTGPFLRFEHSLWFEKIDWHSNFRDGLSFSLSNSYSYDFYRMRNDEDPLSVNLTFSGIGHFIISGFFAISARLQYRHWFYHDPAYFEQASNALRGIADKAISADYMLSLNTDFPFRVLLFTPSVWFGRQKLRFFDFELQASPVFDFALYHDPETQTSFNPKNIVSSGGLELIVFPDFMRRLYVRFCFAVNLRELFTERPIKLPSGDNRELSLVIGHFY